MAKMLENGGVEKGQCVCAQVCACIGVCWRRGCESKGRMVTGSHTLNFLKVLTCRNTVLVPVVPVPAPLPEALCELGRVPHGGAHRVSDRTCALLPSPPCLCLQVGRRMGSSMSVGWEFPHRGHPGSYRGEVDPHCAPLPPKAVRDRKVLFQKRRQKRRDLLFCPVEQDLNMSHLTSPFPR